MANPMTVTLDEADLHNLFCATDDGDFAAAAIEQIANELWTWHNAAHMDTNDWPNLMWRMSERCKVLAEIVERQNAAFRRKLTTAKLSTLFEANGIKVESDKPYAIAHALYQLASVAGYDISAVYKVWDALSRAENDFSDAGLAKAVERSDRNEVAFDRAHAKLAEQAESEAPTHE